MSAVLDRGGAPQVSRPVLRYHGGKWRLAPWIVGFFGPHRLYTEAFGEEAITSYCPNSAEWFAEMFRVFVTNPDLLHQVRPRTYGELRRCFEPVFTDTWRARLAGAPERTLRAAERQVERLAA